MAGWQPVLSLVASVLAASLLLIFVHDSLRRSELLYGRSSQLADDLGMPLPRWNSPNRAQGMLNNIGSGNLKIGDTIQSIKSIQHEPEFAASIHMLETSTKHASDSMEELLPGSTLLHTPVLPDPDTFIAKLRRLRMHSAWCRKHPQLCASPGKTEDQSALETYADEPLEDTEEFSENAAAEQPSEDAALSAKGKGKARTQELWNEPDDNTQLFSPDAIRRMPWLASYTEHRKLKLEEDPLWCGASHCEDHSYARHRHAFAQALPHAIAVNEPLEGRRGGTIQTDPHEKEHFSYARALRRPGVLRGQAI